MTKKSKVLSCVLAVLSGVCFVSGISLLVYEGSDEEHGACEKTAIND